MLSDLHWQARVLASNTSLFLPSPLPPPLLFPFFFFLLLSSFLPSPALSSLHPRLVQHTLAHTHTVCTTHHITSTNQSYARNLLRRKSNMAFGFALGASHGTHTTEVDLAHPCKVGSDIDRCQISHRAVVVANNSMCLTIHWLYTDCSPALSETSQCVVPRCPKDCLLGRWEAWAKCSKTCGMGVKTRTRPLLAAAPAVRGNCSLLTIERQV